MLGTAWESRWLPDLLWGRSSVGRAPALQAGGQEFESLRLHLPRKAAGKTCTLKTPYRRKINEKNQISKTSEKQAMKREAEKQGNEKASPKKEKSCNAIQRRTRSSRKGHRADALALRAEERRDKLRKAAGRGTCPVIRRCLNGETRTGRTPCIHA